ncbi:NAD(P)/FAD-dependent oxidoreductase [Paracoccus sp. (in: a-proteobacteria)]|uniref:NAD(P)/FAD-dependent oxidoreductase n=1 Tax=Paracoccus sp. TaxID=267 RepID=UPI0026DEC72A|nr:NAD(P)/FAD-dependent oxidoreductase [Paracoccus sp. (in: a-proteobacteria)]MDO5648207.1 FCSD flavin-binding domain-containing protein [Paracoccus sp. (in: a-proteobacteria)]
MTVTRRSILGGIALGLAMPAIVRAQAGAAHVVVVGGGFGGATAARYLRRLNPDLRVTLIEPAQRFVTCPFSNLYLGGLREWDSIGHGFDDLRAAGVDVIHTTANDVDSAARRVTLADGRTLDYDRLVLSPGIDIRWNALAGYDEAAAELAPHAWKAGPQTQLLKSQLEAMPDGGTFMMSITDGAFRCPPGPYERASMVAHYLKTNKPKSKILLLDSKDAFSKQGLFQQGWAELYGDMIEWVSLSNDGQVVRVDAAAGEVETAFGTVHRADVLNVVPPQKAGWIADRAGVTNDSGWVPVHGATFASAQVDHIHVVGDATIAAPMPKSGFCANAQGKVVAAAITAELAGRDVPPASFANTCYSLIGPDYGISVAGVYAADGDAIVEIEGSGGVSPIDADAAFRRAEAVYGAGWYAAITKDIWGTA